MKKSIIALSVSVMLAATLSFNANAQSVAVNCDTAQEDIAHLQHEKKSTDERVAKGVFSVMPIGIALNVAASAAETAGGPGATTGAGPTGAIGPSGAAAGAEETLQPPAEPVDKLAAWLLKQADLSDLEG